MTAIANVSLGNTLDFWRLRTNDVINRMNQFAINDSKLYANTIQANNVLKSTGNTVLGAAGKRTIINGALTSNGTITVTTNITASGNVSSNKISVTKNATISGNTSTNKLSVTNRLESYGNNVLGSANKTTIVNGTIASNGNITVTKNLTVSGNTSTNKLSVTNRFESYGNNVLGSANKTTIINGTIASNGNHTISKNLTVSGNTTVSGLIANGSLGTANYVLKTNGTTTFWGQSSGGVSGSYLPINNPVATGILTAGGRAVVNNSLTVSGNTTLGAVNKLTTITGRVSLTGNMNTTGNTVLGVGNKKTVINGQGVANGTFSVSSNMTVTGNTSTNKATVTSLLTVSGNTTTNKATVTSALVVSGNSAIGAPGKRTIINGAGTANGTFSVTTNLTVTGNTSANKMSVTSSITGSAANAQFLALGVGTTPSTNGSIRATNDIIAYYSDDRLKTRVANIDSALSKVMRLNGFMYYPNQTALDFGYKYELRVGVSAQEVQAILPQAVTTAPISDDYLAVQYEKLVPLLIEAIKELKVEIDDLKSRIN